MLSISLMPNNETVPRRGLIRRISEKTRVSSIVIMLLVFVTSCAPTIRQEIPDDETITGSDWSAKDLKDVADYMADSISKASAVPGSVLYGKKTSWILARDLRNDTDEHVNTRTIMEKVRTKLIHGGIASFVDDQAVIDILNQLKFQQSGLFDNKTAARVGKLVGARYILRGTISSIRKRTERTDIIYYNVTLQAVDIETGEIIWTDEKELQRMFRKGLFR